MKRPFFAGACTLGALFGTTLFASSAHAANPQCSATGLAGTPVYLAGSSAVKPVLKELSKTLAALPSPIRVIYQSVSSCTGVSDVTAAAGEKATGTYWDDAGKEQSCDVDTVSGQVPDVGLSDVYPSTCDNVTVPADYKDFLGPIQVMSLVVPPSSKENAISAEAAKVVFGFGGEGTVVTPWSDKSFIFQRPDTSGTRRMIGKAIGLDIGKWRGTEKKGSGDVLSAVHNADATNPNGGIGILAADFADTNRAGTPSAVKLLSFQPQGQSCGYLPDSSSTSFDKVNVRNGLYPIWGPLHLITKVSSGVPAKADVKTVIDYFTRDGLDAVAKKAMIDNEIAAHTVPWCAMNVKRDGEVGVSSTSKYDAPEPCGCYFEFKANGAAPSSCKTCSDDTACGGTNKCRFGYCEAR